MTKLNITLALEVWRFTRWVVMYFTVAYRFIMTSLNMKPKEGVYVLTDYVLEQIYGEKPPAKYSSEETSNNESSESDEFTFPTNKKKQVKSILVERMKDRTTKCKVYRFKNFQLVEHF